MMMVNFAVYHIKNVAFMSFSAGPCGSNPPNLSELRRQKSNSVSKNTKIDSFVLPHSPINEKNTAQDRICWYFLKVTSNVLDLTLPSGEKDFLFFPGIGAKDITFLNAQMFVCFFPLSTAGSTSASPRLVGLNRVGSITCPWRGMRR